MKLTHRGICKAERNDSKLVETIGSDEGCLLTDSWIHPHLPIANLEVNNREAF